MELVVRLQMEALALARAKTIAATGNPIIYDNLPPMLPVENESSARNTMHGRDTK